MEIIEGKYAIAKVFADDAEDYAKAQLKMICDNDAAAGAKICAMPDVHPGKVGPVGLVMSMSVGERVIPQLLGADIGCGMTYVKLNKNKIEFQKLDKVIAENVPSGFKIRKNAHHTAEDFPFEKLNCFKHINSDKAKRSLGTLGGGNHFIEIDKSEDGSLVLIIHTGSRHLGEEVTEYYTKEASKIHKEAGEDVPYYMSYLEGGLKDDYLADVSIINEYASLNREIIAREILKGMKLKAEEMFTVPHNYISGGVLHKGSISAKKGERVLIPINMRDGVILGVGKGNRDWLCSAPHGSGRKLRRDQVKNNYTVSAFKKEMKGIYSTSVGADTLDEAPFAYRSLDDIMENVKETIEITEVLKPVYSFKAGCKK